MTAPYAERLRAMTPAELLTHALDAERDVVQGDDAPADPAAALLAAILREVAVHADRVSDGGAAVDGDALNALERRLEVLGELLRRAPSPVASPPPSQRLEVGKHGGVSGDLDAAVRVLRRVLVDVADLWIVGTGDTIDREEVTAEHARAAMAGIREAHHAIDGARTMLRPRPATAAKASA